MFYAFFAVNNPNMIIHDISLPLDAQMPTYPRVTPYRRTLRRSLDNGDTVNLSDVEMCAHTGTHVDAPFHCIADGPAIESVPLEHCCGWAQVIDCQGCAAIGAAHLQGKLLPAIPRVLLKTDNSERLRDQPRSPFRMDAVFLAADGAEYLAANNIVLVGIDSLAIDAPGKPGKPSHAVLLGKRIVILEGLVLADIEPGAYFLVCAPLKMVGSDGGPCRAILIENPEVNPPPGRRRPPSNR